MPTSKPILCGSIAGSIGGLGVRMHNAAFKALGLDYTYVSFEPTGAKEAISAMRALGIRGLGVTMPFKEAVIPYLDRLDDLARAIGAVNTIVNEGGVLTGYNTDGYGALAALGEKADPTGKRIAILGAGGAAKTVGWALKDAARAITLYNRSEDRGRDAAARIGAQYGGPIANAAGAEYDILINCSAIGFKSEDTPLTSDQLRPGALVFDIVFAPAVTQLAKEAEKAGLTVVRGTRMIMHQAMKQFELYTGVAAPVHIYESVMKSV